MIYKKDFKKYFKIYYLFSFKAIKWIIGLSS